MKIFLDFDDVVFNAKKFKEDLIKIFLKNGISRSEFENSYYTFAKRAQEWGQYYDPKDQVKVLKRRDSINNKKLQKDIQRMMQDLSGYVFKDCHAFLKLFRKEDLYLITYGHIKFQKKKIKGSKIGRFFNGIIVSKGNKIDDIMRVIKKDEFPRDEEIIYIEDRPEQVEQAKKKTKRVIALHMCRPEGRYSNLACEYKDFEVKSLRETVKIVKKLDAKRN